MTTIEPFRICVICTGNTCRSPMAQAILRRMAARTGSAGRIVVDSAGCAPERPGAPPDPRALAALARRDMTLRHHARRFEAADFGRYDLLVVMTRSHRAHLTMLAPSPRDAAKIRLLRAFDPCGVPDGALDIADPYSGDARGYDHTLDIIERCAGALLDTLNAG